MPSSPWLLRPQSDFPCRCYWGARTERCLLKSQAVLTYPITLIHLLDPIRRMRWAIEPIKWCFSWSLPHLGQFYSESCTKRCAEYWFHSTILMRIRDHLPPCWCRSEERGTTPSCHIPLTDRLGSARIHHLQFCSDFHGQTLQPSEVSRSIAN